MVPLTVRCPHCHRNLMDHGVMLDGNASIRVLLVIGDERTTLHLSCIYGSFRYETGVLVSDGKLTELLCPDCERSVLTRLVCEVCSGPLARLELSVDGDVLFCSRRGCKYHRVELRDLENSLVALYGSMVELQQVASGSDS